MLLRVTLGLMLIVSTAGCNQEGSSSSTESGKASSTTKNNEPKTSPDAEAEKILRLALERWKQGKDINPAEQGAMKGISFVRPTQATNTQRILSYKIGKAKEKTGEEMTKEMTQADKIMQRFDFDVTYTPFDPSVRKEYEVEAVFAVMRLNDATSKWAVNAISAKINKPAN